MNIKKLISSLLPLFFAFAVYAQTDTTTTANTKNEFPTTLNAGGQVWNLANQQQDKDVILAEYVTNNEKVDNWTQLVTFQKFKFAFPKELTPAKFAEGEFSQLQKQGYKLKSAILESSPNEAIMEFRIEEPASEQQDEIQRIIKTPSDEVLVFHYVLKKSDMGDAERTKWTTALKGINFPFLLENDTNQKPQT